MWIWMEDWVYKNQTETSHSKTMATDKGTFQWFSQQIQHNQTQSLKMDQNWKDSKRENTQTGLGHSSRTEHLSTTHKTLGSIPRTK